MPSATLKRKPLRAAKVAAQNAHAAPLALSRASFARELAKAFLSPRRSLGPAIIAASWLANRLAAVTPLALFHKSREGKPLVDISLEPV
jgi:hypothetical protein